MAPPRNTCMHSSVGGSGRCLAGKLQFALFERLILLFTCSIWENQLNPNPAVEEAVNTVSWVHQISGLPAVTES